MSGTLGRHREPLFDVPVPCRVWGHHDAGDPYGERLVYVQEAYDVLSGEQSILDACRLLVDQAGIRLLVVEGADRRVDPPPAGRSLAKQMAVGEQSAGVMALLAERPGSVEVWGVDELDLRRRSREFQTRLLASRPAVQRIADQLRDLLHAAQRRHYPPELARIRAALVLRSASSPPHTEVAKWMAGAATASGVHVDDYPSISRLHVAIRQEGAIDFAKVEDERLVFVERIVDKALGWFRMEGGGRVTVNLEQGLPLIVFWLEEIGLSQEEFGRQFEANPEQVLASCVEWYQSWLFRSVRKERGSGVPSSAFMDELMRFALRAEVPYFELVELRRYVSYLRLAEQIPVGSVDRELQACSFALMERAGSQSASQLFELEITMDVLVKALRVEVPAAEFKIADLEPEALGDLIGELAGLARTRVPRRLRRSVADIVPLLQLGKGFVECSRLRGEHMARRTIDLMVERGDDRAVLVAGGFHTLAITRTLELVTRCSWSVLMPTMDPVDVDEVRA